MAGSAAFSPFSPQQEVCHCHNLDAVVIAGSKRIAADDILMIVIAQFHEVRRFTVGMLRQVVADLHIDALIAPDVGQILDSGVSINGFSASI